MASSPIDSDSTIGGYICEEQNLKGITIIRIMIDNVEDKMNLGTKRKSSDWIEVIMIVQCGR